MPKKFENVVFTLKKHQMFYHHTTPEKFQNATITGYAYGNFWQENHMIVVMSSLSVHAKTQSRRFKIPPVWRVLSKSSVRFGDGLVWTVGLTVELKLRFQIRSA